MPITRPTHDEIAGRIATDMDTAFGGGTSAAVDASRLHAFVEHHAGLFHAFYGHAIATINDCIPTSASLAGLQRWGKVFDLPLRGARAALGNAVGTVVPGVTLPAGTAFTAGGQTFETLADVPGSFGFATAAVRALIPGGAGALPTGAALRLVVPIPGVSDTWTVAFPGLVGVDAEDVEAYRERIVDVFRNPPLGGANHDYRRWALQVPGVARAWALPADIVGLGRQAVYVVTAEAELVPPAALVTEVRDFIRARCRSDVNLIVGGPVAITVNVAANVPGLLSGEVTAAEAAARATVAAAFQSAPAVLTTIPTGLGIQDMQPKFFRTTVTAALDAALGRSFTITSPPTDLTPAPSTLSVYTLGSLTLTPT